MIGAAMRGVLGAAAGLALLVGPLSGQEVHITPFVGYAHFLSEVRPGVSFDPAPAAGVHVALPYGRFGFRATLGYASTSADLSELTAGDVGVWLMGGGVTYVLALPTESTTWYAVGIAGSKRYDPKGGGRAPTDPMWGVGLGVAHALGRRVRIGGEAMDYMSRYDRSLTPGDRSLQHDLFLTVGLTLGFGLEEGFR